MLEKFEAHLQRIDQLMKFCVSVSMEKNTKAYMKEKLMICEQFNLII